MGSKGKLYVSDSMFFTERTHISLSQARDKGLVSYHGSNSINNSTLGLNAFPAVKGVAQVNKNNIFWTINGHTMVCHYLEQVYEYILHRSIDRVGGKGMSTILNDTEISTVQIAIGMSKDKNFTQDVIKADQLINEQISIVKLDQIKFTIEEFLSQFGTDVTFSKEFMFSDAIELIGFETKSNGDVFIKVRNKSKYSIQIPSNSFFEDSIYINGNVKYLLNGIIQKDAMFDYYKQYFPTNTKYTPLRNVKKTLNTLENDLPRQQKSATDEIVKKNSEKAKRITFLEPYEIATLKIEFE